MQKILLIIAILSTFLFIDSCKSGPASEDPKATLVAFFESLSKMDMESARKKATADSKGMLDMMEIGMKMGKGTAEMEKFDKSKIEFGDVTINGNNAIVPIKEKGSSESIGFPLKKEGGEWKVAFDIDTMMQLGMHKMEGTNPAKADSLGKALEQIKNMDTDSLQALMKKGMQSLDSIKKVLKDIKSQ